MNRSKSLLMLLALSILGVLVVLVSAQGAARASDPPFTAQPLTDASLDKIAQVALSLTQFRHQVLESPQVVRVQYITELEAHAFELPGCNIQSIEKPPLALVILKGRFLTSGPGFNAHRPVKYLGYIFDLWAGVPCLTMTSPNGGYFAKALNDLSLHDNPLPGMAPTDVPSELSHSLVRTPLPTMKPFHYGETRPGWATPPASDPSIQAFPAR